MIALAAALIAAAVLFSAQLERSAVLHAAAAQQQSERLLTAMLDQETGARGYFGTRDPTFLQPWYEGTDDFAAALRAARRTDAGDPGLERALATQARLASAWHSWAAASIGDVSRRHAAPTLSEARGRKAMMDEFRAVNARYGAEIASRRDAALTRATVLSVVVVLGVSLLIVFAGGASREAQRTTGGRSPASGRRAARAAPGVELGG